VTRPGPGDGAVPPWPRPSALEWLYLAAGLFLAYRYRWLLDDAFVYFRYVDNWVILGLGPVYNREEYVEGFTSPLWLLLLALFRCAGAPFGLIVLVLGALCYVAFWYFLVALPRTVTAWPGANLPLAFLAVNYGALCYFTSGVETPLVQVTAALFALFCARPGSKALQVALAFTPLVRPELSLALVAAAVWSGVVTSRVPWLLVLASAAVSGAYLTFRVYYYADLLPNTFYLKDTSDFAQGLAYVADTVFAYHLEWLAGAAALAVVVASRRRSWPTGQSAPQLMMLLLAVVVSVYVVRIGGDARHYRFFAFPTCLLVCALGGLTERALQTLAPRAVRPAATAAALAVSAVSGLSYPRQLASHPFWLHDDHARVAKITDAAVHRRRREHEEAAWRRRSEAERHAAPGEWMVDGSCVRAFEHLRSNVVHQYGLTDAVLARTAMPAERPAHKRGLEPLAHDLARLRQAGGAGGGRGRFRRATEAGTAPAWVVRNLPALEIVERKMYNRHVLRENFRLAFSFPGPIVP